MFQEDHDLAQRLLDMLDHVDRAVNAATTPDSLGDRLTREQWRVLLLLSDGEGHSMREVAERATVPAATATRLIDRLVSEALAYRRPDPLDRRRVLVYLTDAGRARLEHVTASMRGTVAAAISRLHDDERRQLGDALHRLATELQGL